MNLSEQINLTLSQLGEWERTIFANEQSFRTDLLKICYDGELSGVSFCCSLVHCSILAAEGKRVTEYVSFYDFLRWISTK